MVNESVGAAPNPVASTLHVGGLPVAPVVVEYMPTSVPTNSISLLAGFTAIASTGTSGMPVRPLPSMAVQLEPPLMDLKTCGEPNEEEVAYSVLLLLGSYVSPDIQPLVGVALDQAVLDV